MPPPVLATTSPVITRICPALGEEVGLNESIVLMQVAFWIQSAPADNYIDGHWWTYQSASDMQAKAFPYWSAATINRAVASLVTQGLLIKDNHNKKKYDRTPWYALNPEGIARLQSVSLMQDEPRETQNEARETQIASWSNQNEPRETQNEATIQKTPTKNINTVAVADDDPESGDDLMIASEGDVPRPDDDLPPGADALIGVGVSVFTAKSLAKQYGAARCMQVAEEALRRANNPPGFAVQALREDWSLSPKKARRWLPATNAGVADSAAPVESGSLPLQDVPVADTVCERLDKDAAMAWKITYSQLKLQLERTSFDRWLRDAYLLDCQGKVYTVIVSDGYARDILQHRLYRNVHRILSDVCGMDETIRIEFKTREEVEACQT